MKSAITYDLADNFIHRLADFIDDGYIKKGEDLSRLAIVFGGQRPRLYLQKEISLKMKKPFFPPRFFSMDEFIEHVLSKQGFFRGLSDLEARFAVYCLAKEKTPLLLKDRASFSQFLPWAREILAFVEQLDLEEVEVKSLRDIQFNAAIGYDVPRSINDLLGHIVGLRDAFHDALLQKKAYTRGLMYLLAARSIAQTRFDEFERIFFCNFFYLHKTEKRIIKHLYDSDRALVFFQSDANAWSVFEEASKIFGAAIKPLEPRRPAYKLNIYGGFDLHAQIGCLREVLKTIKEPDRTVIVLPDPESVIPLLSEICSFAGDFNVSMGYPLRRSAVYSLFECLFKAQETRKGKAYYTRDYLRLLSHPLVKNLAILEEPAVTRVLVHKVEEVLVGMEKTPLSGSLFIELQSLLQEEELYESVLELTQRMEIRVTAAELKDALDHLHRLLFVAWEDIGRLGEFAGVSQKLLDVLVRKSMVDRYPLHLKMIARVLDCLEEFRDPSFKDEPFAKEDIFKIFKNKLEEEMVSFSGAPLKGLQILGLMETRALSFENVLVLDVNESVLPKLKIYEPLIPRDVMVSLGLNRLEKEEEIQRYQFLRLIACAKRVDLFFQESEEKEKSRFIEELVWEQQKRTKSLDACVIPRACFRVNVLARETGVVKRPLHIAFLKKYRYSASSLNTYMHCPLRFYYQYVLGLEEKEDLLDEPEASDIGTFIHGVLEQTFAGFVGRRPVIDDKFREFFFETLDKKFEREFSRKMKSDAFLTKEVLDVRLGRFLENEKDRRVRELVCVEKVFEDNIRVAGYDFRFKSKVDRIDRLQDDSLLILDYKTGSGDEMPARPERLEAAALTRESLKNTLKSFQLPLYVYLFQQSLEADGVDPSALPMIDAALYQLRNLDKASGLKRLFREDPGQKEKTMGFFMRALKSILSEILDPAVSFRADEEDAYYCGNCHFFYLCRP